MTELNDNKNLIT